MTDSDMRGLAVMCRIRPLTRRHFLTGASVIAAAPLLSDALAGAQELDATPASGTPISSPATSVDIDVDALFVLSEKLVGGGTLDRKAVEPLAALIGGDPAHVSGFQNLILIDDPTVEGALDELSDDAFLVVNDILQYWYLGYFGDQPVANRADLFFGLPVWSTVSYFTQPTLCKGFGYWATDVDVAD